MYIVKLHIFGPLTCTSYIRDTILSNTIKLKSLLHLGHRFIYSCVSWSFLILCGTSCVITKPRCFFVSVCYLVMRQCNPSGGHARAPESLAHSNAAYISLLLLGKVLHFNALNSSGQRKFRERGNKQGAKQGWELLQQAGLGELREKKACRGTDMVKLS